MNKRALVVALVYCVAVIIFKLTILLGGYTLSKFGFYYSHTVSVFFLIPFLFLAVYQVREKDLGGVIAGREAMRVALTVVAVAAIVLSLYHYMEFKWKYGEIALNYYHSEEYLNILKEQLARHPDKLKETDFPKIIENQIAELSAFRAATGRLTPLVFIGLSGAFITAVFMKRSAK
jgi:hypothetical protein